MAPPSGYSAEELTMKPPTLSASFLILRVEFLTSLTSRDRSVWTVILRWDCGTLGLVESGAGRIDLDKPVGTVLGIRDLPKRTMMTSRRKIDSLLDFIQFTLRIISQIGVDKFAVWIGDQNYVSGTNLKVGNGGNNFHDGIPAGNFMRYGHFGGEIEKFENGVFFELAVVYRFPD